MTASFRVQKALEDALGFFDTTADVLTRCLLALQLADCPEVLLWRQQLAAFVRTRVGTQQTVAEQFAALGVLQQELPASVSGEVIAAAVQRLVLCEVKPGGPYKSTHDDSVIANLLIYRFLKNMAAVPTGLHEYVKRVTPTVAVPGFAAFLATGSLQSNEDSAILLQSLNDLVSAQNYDGSWGKKTKDQLFVTALAIRRLAQGSHSQITTKKNHADVLKSAVYELAEKEIKTLPLIVRPVALRMLADIKQVDPRAEIALISWFFVENSPQQDSLTYSRVLKYGVANVALWMAYTIYDDFIDEEGVPALLPLANIMHRKALELYYNLAFANQTLYYITVVEAFDAMDAANKWELAHCRFVVLGDSVTVGKLPDFAGGRVLAKRARGHIIGPLLELRRSSISHSQQLSVQRGLEQYLIARQLNDDIHDWKQDLRVGQITFVVTYLLKHAEVTPGRYKLPDLIEQLEVYFWQAGFTELNKIILLHCKNSRRSLSAGGLSSSGYFIDLVATIEDSIKKSNRVFKDQHQFLESYQVKY
jgi:hypothetical protein